MQPRQSVPSVKNLLALLGAGIFVEGAILLVAGLLRFWALDLKPAHFDEGINGWFVDQMRSAGFYRYDPDNYHGPLYFYVLFVSLSLLGRNLWALRLPAVLSGIATVWLALRFDRYLGKIAARMGALALALSPAAVFYSRYAIHESSLVVALLITALGILGLWQSGSRRDLTVTFCGFTLLLLIKETAVIHIGCFFIAAGCLALWQHVVPSLPQLPAARPRWSLQDFEWRCALSLLAILFFYSGTFLNWPGTGDFIRAFVKWFHTGTGEGGHVKTDYQIGSIGFLNYYWLALMGRYEWPSLLGLLYVLRLLFPAPAMLRYLAIYGLGVLVAYSIVPYKTPWCIISIIWPFALLFGCALDECWKRGRRMGGWRLLAVALGVLLPAASLFMALRLNFRHFSDPKEPYVYVQTMPGIGVVTAPLLGMASRDTRNFGIGGQIALESYYPLPWILGDFPNIGYYGKEEIPSTLCGDFIVALTAQQAAVEKKLGQPYLRRRFQLRDSMEECTVWFRESLFREWFADPAHGVAELVSPGK